jgi:hypothetical protein
VNSRTLAASLLAAIVLVSVALTFGWRSYEANPQGLFLHTPTNWCAPRSHSFTVAFQIALVLGALFLLAVATVAFIASLFPSLSGQLALLRVVAKVSLTSLLFVALGALLSIPLESQLLLQKDAACVPTQRPSAKR